MAASAENSTTYIVQIYIILGEITCFLHSLALHQKSELLKNRNTDNKLLPTLIVIRNF